MIFGLNYIIRATLSVWQLDLRPNALRWRWLLHEKPVHMDVYKYVNEDIFLLMISKKVCAERTDAAASVARRRRERRG